MLLQLERESVGAVSEKYGAAVARATERILELRRSLGECVARHLADLGDELEAVKRKLAHGDFTTWLRRDAGLEPKTARRAMSVARFRRTKGTTLSLFSAMDASRIYRLAELPPALAGALTPETALPARPGGPPKPLGLMTAREFDAALDLLEGIAAVARKTPSLPGISLPVLDTSSRDAFARSFLAAVELLIRHAPLIRTLPGRLLPALKERAEQAIEELRRLVLRWPAWARGHR